MPRDNDIADIQEREIGLFEMIGILKKGWHFWVGGAFFGVLIGGVATIVLPSQYEANLVLQVPSDLVAHVIERMKMSGFLNEVASKLGSSDVLHLEEVKIKKVGADLLELSYRDRDREKAQQVLLGIEDILRARRRVAVEQDIKDTQAQLDLVQKQIVESDARRQEIIRSLPRQKYNSLQDVYMFVSLAFVQQNSGLVEKELELKNKLRNISSTQIVPLENISVAAEPVFPKKRESLLLGGLGGFVLGILGLMFRRAWRMVPSSR